ncbi:MAG: hypothetical protein JXB46_01940, partial [Candidatus Eisenbacteria bacterium]|nr:hypothetical protein [Candidatus Eisenbacteria bacterium]
MTLKHLAHGLAIALVCLALPAWATGPSVDASFGAESVTLSSAGEFSRISLEHCRPLSAVGKPELPLRVLRFVIPADMRVSDVIVSEMEETTIPGVHMIVPAQPRVPIGETAEWAAPDQTVYGSDERYPAERVEYLGEGYLGGYRIASVAVYPMQYQPASGKLTLVTDISVELKLSPDADRSRPRHRITANSAEIYRDAVRALVENPEEVDDKLSAEVIEDVGPEGFLPRYTPSLEGSPVDYVIITKSEYVPYFQQLADWKTKKGVPTVVKTVAWIESNYPGGCDTAERIRYFIADAYESWGTSFFLLGGDTDTVPVRYGWSAYYGGWDVSGDLYYSDLDYNWNRDGDSRFGEGYAGVSSPGDSLDMYPDVFVGRAPVETTVETETFIAKTLTYEKSPIPTFAQQNLYLGEVLFPYDWQPGDLISTDGATDVIEPALPLLPPEVHPALLYQNYEPYPESFPLSSEAAIDSLNVGYNITSHVGHGSKDIMRASYGDYITLQDIDGLSNGTNRSGFVWMLNCTSTQIESDCVSEHFMNNPNGGATFVFGPSRFCFPTTAKDYYLTWHGLLYGGVERTGVVSAMCKVPYVAESTYDNTDRWTQMSYLLLGDPESRLWTKRPIEISAIHDSSVPLGPTSLSVTVIDPSPVDSAYVCVAKAGEVYARGYTNASGQAILSFTPKTTGSMTIAVTARNHFPYEDTIGVTATSGAHVTLREMDVDDDSAGLSDGNGNGRAEAGETVELDMTVGNGGTAQATTVTATLATSDPNVVLVDSTHALGNIPAGGQLVFDAAFAVEISGDCPNDYDVDFTVQFTTPSRGSWTNDYVLRVGRPNLVQLRNNYQDGNDGVPAVGETVTLTVDILNDGNADADGVTGVLSYPSAEVTITDDTDSWGDIDAGGWVSGQNNFVFTINDSLTADFELDLTDEDGKTWVLEFDVTAPSIPLTLDGRVKATTVHLMWDPVDDGDLWGYNVYRTDQPLGAFVLANDLVVERISYYEDAGLADEHMYYYRVAAVDSSGNEGALSETLAITTNPPSQSGWPLRGGESMYGSPLAVDVDLDGDLEVLVGSGEVYGWHLNGVEITDGDGDPRTEGILADEG